MRGPCVSIFARPGIAQPFRALLLTPPVSAVPLTGLRRNRDLRWLDVRVAHIHFGHNLNRPRRLRRLHDHLRQAAEERASRLLVAFLAVGVAVAHADQRDLARNLEIDEYIGRWHGATLAVDCRHGENDHILAVSINLRAIRREPQRARRAQWWCALPSARAFRPSSRAP